MTCREVLLGTYGHHHPDLLPGATNINTAKHRVTVVGRWPALKALGKKAKSLMITWSEWQDLNLRPPASRTGSCAGEPLNYKGFSSSLIDDLAVLFTFILWPIWGQPAHPNL